MPLLKKTCGLSLKNGGILYGCLGGIFSIYHYFEVFNKPDMCTFYFETDCSSRVTTAAFLIILLVTNVMLIVGSHMSEPCCILPWMVIYGILFTIIFPVIIYYGVTVTITSDLREYNPQVMAYTVLALVACIYIWISVFSLHQKLQKEEAYEHELEERTHTLRKVIGTIPAEPALEVESSFMYP